MSQDLLLAVGSRIEARLKAKDSRAHTATDVGTTALSAKQPFTLLEDTKPASFLAPDAAPAVIMPSKTAREDEPTFSAEQTDFVAKAQAMAISMAVSMASTATSATGAGATPPMASESASPVASYSASTDTATATAADTASTVASAGSAATPPVRAYTPPVPAYTPPVPAEFGVGAVFGRFAGDTPMTVTRLGDGVVFAMYTDSEGTREVAFHPTQLSLITAAP
jgi:hypothetical protein